MKLGLFKVCLCGVLCQKKIYYSIVNFKVYFLQTQNCGFVCPSDTSKVLNFKDINVKFSQIGNCTVFSAMN